MALPRRELALLPRWELALLPRWELALLLCWELLLLPMLEAMHPMRISIAGQPESMSRGQETSLIPDQRAPPFHSRLPCLDV